jgi:hypothetical protein
MSRMLNYFEGDLNILRKLIVYSASGRSGISSGNMLLFVGEVFVPVLITVATFATSINI